MEIKKKKTCQWKKITHAGGGEIQDFYTRYMRSQRGAGRKKNLKKKRPHQIKRKRVGTTLGEKKFLRKTIRLHSQRGGPRGQRPAGRKKGEGDANAEERKCYQKYIRVKSVPPRNESSAPTAKGRNAGMNKKWGRERKKRAEDWNQIVETARQGSHQGQKRHTLNGVRKGKRKGAARSGGKTERDRRRKKIRGPVQDK